MKFKIHHEAYFSTILFLPVPNLTVKCLRGPRVCVCEPVGDYLILSLYKSEEQQILTNMPLLRERRKDVESAELIPPAAEDSSSSKVPLASLLGYAYYLLSLNSVRRILYLVALWWCLFVMVVGAPFPNRTLPALPPLPAHPTRAMAVLHSDSNPCYDMLLLVFLHSWWSTRDPNLEIPMLLLHSAPLPPKVTHWISQHEQDLVRPNFRLVQPITIPVVKNRFVVKDRVRTAAAKFAVWDQTHYDQVAYFDSDHVFFGPGHGIFDAIDDHHNWMHAVPYAKYDGKIFNSGNFLLRPSRAVYEHLLELFARRFWILSFHQFLKTADQGFLNAVFEGHWKILHKEQLGNVRHIKLWLAIQGQQGIPAVDQAKAQAYVKELQLEQDLQACLAHRRSK